MVKIKGPGLSQEASGKFADLLTYAKLPTGAYLKRKVKPANPRTGLQVGHRAMVAYLGPYWKTMNPKFQESWRLRAELTQISPYHAFLSYNLARWGNYMGPLRIDIGPTLYPPLQPLASSMVGGVGMLTYGAYCGVAPSLWGYAVAISLDWGVWPQRDQTVICYTGNTGAFAYVEVNGLPPGHYKGRSRPFDTYGNMGNNSSLRNCVVT